MKKKIIMGALALAFAAASAYGIKRSMDSDAELSDLALANVEALAQGEGPGTSNTGPAFMEKCGGWLSGKKIKICMSQNNYPCTESGCQ